MRPELLLREPESALLAAGLEQLADAALVGREPGDLADDLADDLDALGGALELVGLGWLVVRGGREVVEEEVSVVEEEVEEKTKSDCARFLFFFAS